MKKKLIFLFVFLMTFYKSNNAITREYIVKSLTEHPIISTLITATWAYSVNKFFNHYEKNHPKSYLPVIGRSVIIVYPVNIALFAIGFTQIYLNYQFNNDDNSARKRKDYLLGVYQLCVASMLFYLCYKRI